MPVFGAASIADPIGPRGSLHACAPSARLRAPAAEHASHGNPARTLSTVTRLGAGHDIMILAPACARGVDSPGPVRMALPLPLRGRSGT